MCHLLDRFTCKKRFHYGVGLVLQAEKAFIVGEDGLELSNEYSSSYKSRTRVFKW